MDEHLDTSDRVIMTILEVVVGIQFLWPNIITIANALKKLFQGGQEMNAAGPVAE